MLVAAECSSPQGFSLAATGRKHSLPQGFSLAATGIELSLPQGFSLAATGIKLSLPQGFSPVRHWQAGNRDTLSRRSRGVSR